MRYSTVLTGLASVFFVASPLALGGDLNPPAGPVAATGRFGPRTEINQANTPGDADSLFKITRSGSYYVGGNITGVAAKHGIEIAASGVTIDLMGFELLGIVGSLDGVNVTAFAPVSTNIAVINGSLRNWGGSGVNVSSADNTLLTDLRVSANGTSGISARDAAVITRCAAVSNGLGGISAVSGATISNCSARSNGGIGINASLGAMITACSASSNTGTGIDADLGSTISNCSARSNGVNGINASARSTVTACAASSNGTNGIFGSTSVTITDCSAVSNGGDGIHAGNGSTVSNCTASLNIGDGIQVSSQCLVLANTCYLNGATGGNAAGIHTTSFDNRIDGNNVTRGDRGIDVDSTGSLIIRNSASGNTVDYSLVAGNTVGAIFNFSGGGTISSIVVGGTGVWAGPWANFQY